MKSSLPVAAIGSEPIAEFPHDLTVGLFFSSDLLTVMTTEMLSGIDVTTAYYLPTKASILTLISLIHKRSVPDVIIWDRRVDLGPNAMAIESFVLIP